MTLGGGTPARLGRGFRAFAWPLGSFSRYTRRQQHFSEALGPIDPDELTNHWETRGAARDGYGITPLLSPAYARSLLHSGDLYTR